MSDDLAQALADAADGSVAVASSPIASERIPGLVPVWGPELTAAIMAAVKASDGE